MLRVVVETVILSMPVALRVHSYPTCGWSYGTSPFYLSHEQHVAHHSPSSAACLEYRMEANQPQSRVARPARQRPLSTVVTSSFQNPTSPPRVPRRLSDQQDRPSRMRRTTEEQPTQHTGREVPYRSSTTERPSLSLDATRTRTAVSSLRPSPITPRTYGGLDNPAEGSSIFTRRPGTSEHVRTSSHRQPSGLSKSFQSSSLVPKSSEAQNPGAAHHEASESSNSTAAPSTVWDELDELKSRIHRLELTGKLPRTSGAAMSRASEERPPTAGTGATTVSGSPKRASTNGAAQTEIMSMSSQPRDAQPILRSALSKTKPFVTSDIYSAVEAAANDAMALSQMMGTAGQPGPISSGASTIGGSGLTTTVTDRLLRKKVESMCRNLTELCLALTDEGSQRKAATKQPKTEESRETIKSKSRDQDPGQGQDQLSSPPPITVFTGAPRRETSNPDEPVPSVENSVSPRATRLEKRATFNFTAPTVPSPRYAPSALGGEVGTPGRKSSLVVARTRRGVTDEPDDQGRKTSLLRTRRAGTDEPEEGRKASFLLPPRRVTTIARGSNIDEEPDTRFSRAPSRAITEVSGLRVDVPSRDREDVTRGSFQMPEPASASSALSRRRLITSNLPSATPTSSRFATPTTPSSRRFLGSDRFTQERDDRVERVDNSITEKLAEQRHQRYSVGQSNVSMVGRETSIARKRHSGIPSISGTSSNFGGYR
jgi:hypothetical protein